MPTGSFTPIRPNVSLAAVKSLTAPTPPSVTVQPLIIPEVDLIVKGQPVAGPLNVVYSTSPLSARDDDGTFYYVKGEDDPLIVLAEVLGHILAGFVEIPVPQYAVGRFGKKGAPVFASAVVEDAVRDVSGWVKKKKVKNWDVLPRVIALDVWLANNDRNMGNLLGRAVPEDDDGHIELIAIDFEKSATVRKKAPMIEIATMTPKAFWPRDELGKLCKSTLKWDAGIMQRFDGITDGQIEQAVSASVAAVGHPDADGRDNIAHVLKKRRNNLAKLVHEVWN
ncbi:MAG TPA: hypothetical protein VJA21_12120 [Verrucomicrobiae bacterium]